MTRTRSHIYVKRNRRARRVRAKIIGSAARPRLAVFRSNRFMYAQLIDDMKGHTLCAVSSKEIAPAKKESKTSDAVLVGELIAKKGHAKGITRAVFDRRSYRYHGRVRALADAARKAGLQI